MSSGGWGKARLPPDTVGPNPSVLKYAIELRGTGLQCGAHPIEALQCHDKLILNHQIGYIFADISSLVAERKGHLSLRADAAQRKFPDQGAFVDLLHEAGAQHMRGLGRRHQVTVWVHSVPDRSSSAFSGADKHVFESSGCQCTSIEWAADERR
jgi:hypothetical protein